MNSDSNSFCVNIADLGTPQTSIRDAWKMPCHLYMWHPGNGQVRICELLLDFKALHPGTPGFSHSLNSFLCFLVFRNDAGPGSLLGWQADANSATKQGRSTLQQAAHQAQPFSRGTVCAYSTSVDGCNPATPGMSKADEKTTLMG